MNEAEQINDAKAKARNVASSAAASVKSAASAVSDKAADVAAKVSETASNAGAYARDQYDQLGGKAREAYQSARDTGRSWAHEADGYIHRRPLTALAIAAGVGFLAGMYIKRK